MAMIGNNKTGKPFWEYLFGSNEPTTTTTAAATTATAPVTSNPVSTVPTTKPTLVDKVKDLWDTARTPTINADGSEGLTPMQAFSQAILTTPSNSAGLILGKGMQNVYDLNQASAKNQKALEDKRTKDANRLALGKALSMAKTPEEVQAAISQYPDATVDQIVGAASGTIDYYAKQKENADKYADNDKDRANRLEIQKLQEAGANGRLTEQGRQRLAELQAEANIDRGNADYYAEQGYDSSGKPIELPEGSVDINGNPTGSSDASGKGTVKVYDKVTGVPRYATKAEAATLTTPDGQYVAEQPPHIAAAYKADSEAILGFAKVDEKTGKSTNQMIQEAKMRGDNLAKLNERLGEKNVIDQAQAAYGSVTGTNVEPDYNAWTQATAADFALSMIPGMGTLSNMESSRLQLTVPSAKDPKEVRDRYVKTVQAKAAIAQYGKELMNSYIGKGMPFSGNQAYEKELTEGAERIIQGYGL